MPFISNNKEIIYHNDIKINAEIEISYNQRYGFYALLPPEYNTQFDLLDDIKKKEFKALHVLKSKYSHSDFKRAVSCDTESATLTMMKDFIKYLLTSKVEKRNVIIVGFKGNIENTHPIYSTYKFPAISMSIDFVYCTEVTVPGNKPVYNIYGERENNYGEKTPFKEEVRFGYRHKSLIIDDTPANRVFLENLYGAFGKLITKMNEFTKDSDSLLTLIASNQNLLN